MTTLSVLDLVPIRQGATAGEALAESVALAQHVERLGFRRFWVAEHHNMAGIASAATSVVIGHLAAHTSAIRVGAGGIMLPNHSPLVIAEQFGTLEALYPGRIDLGLGRAPGSDQITARAMRRDLASADSFPQDVQELRFFLGDAQEGQPVVAVPGAGSHVPLWILGSSTFGSQLAALLGLPYAFASHFAPDALLDALAIYREGFKPSDQLERPYAMAGVNVVAADTEEEARRLFTTIQQAFANIRRGRPAQYPPPIDDIEGYWTGAERAMAQHMLRYAIVGTPDQVRDGLQAFVDLTGVDEVMAVSAIFDQGARMRSYEILAEVGRDVRPAAAVA